MLLSESKVPKSGRTWHHEPERGLMGPVQKDLGKAFSVAFRLDPWSLTSSAEQLAVGNSRSFQVVTVSRQTEHCCQLPPHSEQKMWKWDDTRIMLPTDLLEGREDITLCKKHLYKLHNFPEGRTRRGQNDPRNSHISVWDQYHCLFKDRNTCEKATMVLRVRTEGSPLRVSLVMPLWTLDPEFMNAGS